MELKKLETLKTAAQKGGPIDPRAVLQLISEHESIIRAETFWSDRAPKMNDELLILRQLEAPARAHVAHEPEHERSKAMAPVLAQLDELRAIGRAASGS